MENIVNFRKAEKKDVELILWFIQQMADYEKLSHEVTATPELLAEWIFEKNKASVIFAEVEDKTVGFVLYFYNFSTFVGKAGLYIEDIFVLPEERGKGYGKAIMKHLALMAYQQNLGRMEWTCLDWNINSINFYKSIGARPMDEWTNFRLTEKAILEFIGKDK